MLPRDLFWITFNGRRPSTWRAPTWSWASVVGPISWLYEFSDEVRYLAKARAVVQPAGINKFGELTSGTLWLTAPSMEVKVHSQHTLPSGRNDCTTMAASSIDQKSLSLDGHPSAFIFVDSSCDTGWGNVVGNASMQVVLLYDQERDSDIRVGGLILLCVDAEKDIYERIGAYERVLPRDREDWEECFKSAKERTFTVV
jgi:hypothetical protein